MLLSNILLRKVAIRYKAHERIDARARVDGLSDIVASSIELARLIVMYILIKLLVRS